jgi:hypothetical protein
MLCFVLGAPRSGTTLLRVMLAGHPGLFSPPEMVIAPFVTMADRRKRLTERFWEKGGLRRAIMEIERCDVDTAKGIEASFDDKTVPEVYAWLEERLDGRILVDKCPHLSVDPPALDRLRTWYPDARWVWIVRHPGSVLRSIENMPMAEVILQGYAGDPREIWRICNRNIQQFLATIPDDRKATVRYEDIVSDRAKAALEPVCGILGVPWDDALLTPYEGDRMREGPPGARAVGDPNLAGRKKIEPELATKWLDGFDPGSVGPDTHKLASELGYDLGKLSAPPITRVTSAMNALLGAVQTLEQQIRVAADIDQVEGRRFLLRQLAHSVDMFVEHGDPDHPSFVHAEGPTRKSFADCPDADYLRATIRTDGRTYRLRGRVRVGTTYVGVLLYRRGGKVGNRLRDVDFVRPDGTFDVRVGTASALSAHADGATALVADGDETAVIVRQYFTDRSQQPPIAVTIVREGPATVPAPLDADTLAKGLEKARKNLEATQARTLAAYKMASVGALNRFIPIGGEDLFPTPDNAYQVCWYRLGEDQQILVRGTLPKARYVSFTLYNVWMESLDYTHRTVSLNHTQLGAVDGEYEIVVGHRDPGRPWLDVAGHLAGYLLMRNLLPDGEIPVPSVEVRYEWEK